MSKNWTPQDLRSAGELLYGHWWQTALARDLYTDARTVRRWAAGERAVPGPARRAIEEMLKRQAIESALGLDTAQILKQS